ncbi:LysR family transcriptional regulator [Alicyclobacillus hesperidum]|uniref:DNA-binding transcriptional regulator, LysR family n=1 Tax=Alicyclobacillus hesperidum TaxID=89784 RepID=A0A1H2W2T6_9BACL|nr:LysR family transcriptional regulator [Alicyclobacillus hesperidum]GLV14827.1 LysR family transcriptional regulator [Alicyclobacillus hesperidum]SDW74918.1 DNA-binding transcriptional regulator, LysR family [Alicyclobacillus hesperidum]
MELLQLEYFQTVARLQHMTKAAEELQIAQPSLSKTISRLEEDLGVPLFDRTGRQIRLNAYGEAFLARVQRAFVELNEGKREIRDLARLNEDIVTLAVSTPRILPGLLGAFLASHPDVRFRQFFESAPEMKRQIENGEVDFCISSAAIEGIDIEWRPLLTEEIFLIVPSNHPLAVRESIRLAEVKDEPFISMNAGYEFRELTDRLCREAGFVPHIHFAGDEPDVIAGLVQQGLGVAFVPALTWLEWPRRASHRLRIEEPACQRQLGIAWSERRYFSTAAERFRVFAFAYFRDVAKRLVREFG